MKAMGGGGGSFSQSTAKFVAPKTVKPGGPKKLSHKELIAKWTRQGGKFEPPKKVWTRADIDRARNSKDKSDDAAAAAEKARTDAGTADEVVEEWDGRFQASEIARVRMAELAEERQIKAMEAEPESAAAPSDEADESLVDSRRSQLEELEMLEAMYTDEFTPLYDATSLDELRAKLDAGGEEALTAAAAHPPIELLLQMTVPDQRPPEKTDGKQLVASMLLHLVFPTSYPSVPPEFRFEDIMITDALEEITLDKVLWPVIYLDEEKLTKEMLKQADEVLPGPCVYEVVTWMSENAFSFPL